MVDLMVILMELLLLTCTWAAASLEIEEKQGTSSPLLDSPAEPNISAEIFMSLQT